MIHSPIPKRSAPVPIPTQWLSVHPRSFNPTPPVRLAHPILIKEKPNDPICGRGGNDAHCHGVRRNHVGPNTSLAKRSHPFTI